VSSPYVKCCKTSLLSLVAVFIRQYSTVIRNVSSVPCVWLYSYIVVLHADRAMLPVAKHLHICWLGHWFNVPWCNWNIFLISRESQVWSVFRWDMNVEQAGKSCMQPMKVCLPWLNSYRWHTQLYARLWRYLSSYSKLVDLCVWILFMWYQKVKVSCLVVCRNEGTFEPTAEMLSREAGPIPWPFRSCEFTLLDSVL